LSYGRAAHRARSRWVGSARAGRAAFRRHTGANPQTVRQMPTTGLEPVRHFWHWSLKPACLPISARGQIVRPVRRRSMAPPTVGNDARRGIRTLTGLLPQDPESCASTSSAIRAGLATAAVRPASGAEGSRTPDLLNAIQALSQLSYSPGSAGSGSRRSRHDPNCQTAWCSAGLTGLEPATSGVTDRHSNRLSYSPRCALPGQV
jgi:hypothetical protein